MVAGSDEDYRLRGQGEFKLIDEMCWPLTRGMACFGRDDQGVTQMAKWFFPAWGDIYSGRTKGAGEIEQAGQFIGAMLDGRLIFGAVIQVGNAGTGIGYPEVLRKKLREGRKPLGLGLDGDLTACVMELPENREQANNVTKPMTTFYRDHTLGTDGGFALGMSLDCIHNCLVKAYEWYAEHTLPKIVDDLGIDRQRR